MSYLGTPVPKDYKVNTYEFIAEAGQTIFPCVYTSYVDVYLNGFLLSENDYTATSKVDIVLNQACSGDELVSIRTYSNIIGGLSVYFEDILETPNTISGYGITDAYTKEEVDTAIANVSASITTVSLSGTSQQVVDSIPLSAFSSGEYLISGFSDFGFNSLKINFSLDNSGIYVNNLIYAQLGPDLGTFDTLISDSTFNLVFTPYYQNTEIKFTKTVIENTQNSFVQLIPNLNEGFGTTDLNSGVNNIDLNN